MNTTELSNFLEFLGKNLYFDREDLLWVFRADRKQLFDREYRSRRFTSEQIYLFWRFALPTKQKIK
jgi:hypothetical protein